MVDVVLVHPEIPQNTGNIIRLCANTGTQLHLVEPLGFNIDDASLRRAGLDYHEWVTMTVHNDVAACQAFINSQPNRTNESVTAREQVDEEVGVAREHERTWYAHSAHGTRNYASIAPAETDVYVFGGESSGLDAQTRSLFAPDRLLKIPMMPNNRSLNLSNSVAVVVYNSWGKRGFFGAQA